MYWEDDDAWYAGVVAECDANSSKVLILYEDGDEEWIDLAREKVEWIDAKATTLTKELKKATAMKRKRATAVIESDDDDDNGGKESEYELSEEEEEESEDDVDLVVDDGDDDEDIAMEMDEEEPVTTKKKPKSSLMKTTGAGTRTPGVAVNNGVSITPASADGPPTTTPTATKQHHRRPVPGHAPASSSALRAALDRSPSQNNTASASTALVDAATAAATDASRFSSREASRFPFLLPNKIQDANRRRPGSPGYDPTTLHIPPDWFKQNKISEGQRQWWEFKSANWGSVLLFKMGKFYEMFEMDAHVGAECLGLSYMKGDQPHCGFPEAGYAAMAERLARAGHRVVVIEQTETPDGLAKRNEDRKRRGLKKDAVVRREKVAVLSKGTLVDADMMSAVADAQYIMSLFERQCTSGSGSNAMYRIGAVAVDVASGQVLIGEWNDDDLRTRLRAVLTALSPVEVVLPTGGGLSGASRRVVMGVLRSPLVNEMALGDGDGQFWSAEETWKRLLEDAGASATSYVEEEGEEGGGGPGGYYASVDALPPVLREMRDSNATASTSTAALSALGGCISYLQGALLDRRVLGAGRLEPLSNAVGVAGTSDASNAVGSNPDSTTATATAPPAPDRPPSFMLLDGPALENLEILENAEGGIAGTLMAALDHCTTPFGRRRLRQWLCRPLCRAEDIVRRQDAVADLMGPVEEASGRARKILAGVSDLERALARLGASGAGVGSLRDAPRVILYENVSKKRVQAFVNTLRALERVQEAISVFSSSSVPQEDIKSTLLKDLVTPVHDGGSFPDLASALSEMQSAADWDEAESSGRVVPVAGMDPAYDAAVTATANADTALEEYLTEIKAELGSRDVRFASLNKESHVIECGEGVVVPKNWEAMQGKKGVKRYINAELRDLVSGREKALEMKEKAQAGILQAILRRFAENNAVWTAAVEAVAVLDALMSLAVAAACAAGPMVRPTILPWSLDADPVFEAIELRHPAGITVGGSTGSGAFVPNDVTIGGGTAGSTPPFIVLTGPNMGGKSTLMRQVCLAAVAAQVGAWVPARSLTLTPADAVFVRMGARDRIMLGQSTFFVELSETAAALASATRYSLVALDELGRGTATTDGAAIASAVLDHLSRSIKCRGVFATHYHHISDSHASDPHVSIKHMGCAVTPATAEGEVEEVTFLYRLTDGACPKSYGVNVARLAGLPEEVVYRAAVVSEQAEERGVGGLKTAPLGTVAAVGGGGGGGGDEMEVDDGEDVSNELLGKVVAACRQATQASPEAGLERMQREVRLLLEGK